VDGPLNAVIEVGALVILLMLACPAIMGVMMLLMWRSMRHDRRDDA
jgi:hypothetical protein